MDRNTWYTFKEVCNVIDWVKPQTVRVYLSTGKMEVRNIYEETTGKRYFFIEDVNKWANDNRPNNATMRKRNINKILK